uniref:Aquaporin n=1 Tax=Heterorhabditis bacteriophora TaxID=37862 RepID=A0A1I7XNH4_HETBA
MQAQAVGTHDGVLHAAFAHGVTIFVLASAFGGISGAHINPAVTIGIATIGKISPIHALMYILSQLAGGFVGALLVRAILSYKVYASIQAGATLCGMGIDWYQEIDSSEFDSLVEGVDQTIRHDERQFSRKLIHSISRMFFARDFRVVQ